MDAVRAIGRARERRGEAPVHKTAVYRYPKGSIHRRAKKERRGRPRLLKTANVKRLDSARRRLISEADNEWQVTHADVAREAGYDGHACGRVLADALRSTSVRSRTPRAKVGLTAEDARVPLRVAREWIHRPAGFWVDGLLALHFFGPVSVVPLVLLVVHLLLLFFLSLLLRCCLSLPLASFPVHFRTDL